VAGIHWFGFPVDTPHEEAKTTAVEYLRTYDLDPIVEGPEVIEGSTWGDDDPDPPQLQVRIVTAATEVG
jgi:hypothetical protein